MCQQLRLGEAIMLAVILMGAASMDAQAPKRAPSGFMGMRGKKSDVDELPFDQLDKRAPGMGFQGMRGKKDQYAGAFQDALAYYEKRAPGMGFMGMRGKKDGDVGAFDDVDKRAPSMGFQGVRGKKDQRPVGDADLFEKRAPGMGFMGMRGKKDPDQAAFEESDFDVPSLEHDLLMHGAGQDVDAEVDYKTDADDIWGEGFEKRAPSGFMGMRGKKAPSGFMGMRGKKAPSGFMGMRGKKVPSGFMGMRGKKDDSSSLGRFLESLEAAELRDQADAQARIEDDGDVSANVRQKRYRGPKNIKKAPSGFVGMRGKKWNTDPEARGPQTGDAL